MTFFRTIDKRFWWMLCGAAAIIFFRISHVDMTGDDAHYSARAIGMADFMFGDAKYQSTPLQWFKEFPLWSRLSFHDHPKLLFLIQHIFLSIDDTIFFAKLPYALLALGSVFLIYLYLRRDMGETVGLLGALLLSLHAHFIWTGRVSFMEVGVIFFTLVAFLSFERFLTDRSRWLEFGAALGLALDAKLTTLYLLPAFLLYLLIRRRDLIRRKELYLAWAVTFIVISPTIFYNTFMYRYAGHFSLQFARLLGQKTPWQYGGILTDIPQSAVSLVWNLGQTMSWPYFAIWMLSLAYGIAVLRTRMLLPILGTVFLGIQQLLIGTDGYVLAPFSVFAAITVAFSADDLYRRYAHRSPLLSRFFRVGGAVAAAYLLLFAVNSHALIQHRGPVGWMKSQVTSKNYGIAQLDAYLDTLISQTNFGKQDVFWTMKKPGSGLEKYLANLTDAELYDERQHATVIVYDNSINWFSRVWLFERRRFYDNVPFVGTNEKYFLKGITVREMYFIRATYATQLDADALVEGAKSIEEKLFIARGIEPALIRRDDGEVAFKVYHATPEDLLRAAL